MQLSHWSNGRVFTNGLGDRVSIPGWVIPKTQKRWYLMPPCLKLSIINLALRYESRVKWSNPRNGVVPSPTPRCSSYRKGSLRVTLHDSHQLYLLFTYGISTTVGYLMPNPFLHMQTVLFQTICYCCILTFDPAQNAIQGDAPEGSDTFQCVS